MRSSVGDIFLTYTAAFTGRSSRQYHTVRRSTNWFQPLRKAASASIHTAGFRPLPVLRDGSTSEFQQRCLLPGQPALLPREISTSLPAMTKWFHDPEGPADGLRLNQDYLHQYGHLRLPFELTARTKNGEGDDEASFQRLQGIFSPFIQWANDASGQEGSDRLYLAQASLSGFPLELQRDFPPPELLWSGKGDIYDTNLWIGVAPTYTPLHRDPNPNLFVQLAGKKMIRLYEPTEGLRLYCRVQERLGRTPSPKIQGDEMMSGRARMAMEGAVWGEAVAGEAVKFEASLHRGDNLFIPKGWWHSLKGVGPGIIASVSARLLMSFLTGRCSY